MAEWKEYTGSPEQIKELNRALGSSNSGVLLKLKDGTEIIIRSHLYAYDFVAYLICNPHPLADMICKQARTGQLVYWGAKGSDKLDNWSCDFIPWNQHEIYDYSFTEFKEEV